MDSDPNPMRRREEEEEEAGTSPPSPIFRDIRRYYCDYCGICRSKKSLISSHIQSQHKDEIKDKEKECDDERPRSYDCKECGASFKRPAYLKEHMQRHSLVVLEENLDGEDVQWSQTGVWVAGKEYQLARVHFLSQN